MSGLQQTYSIDPPRVDLVKNDFDTLVYQKGRDVLYEKALQCPCKSKATNQQSNCKNCGGTGWVFVNPKKTRMVVTGVAITTDYKAWSEESRGMINITANESEQLTFMDRITLLDGNAIFNEVLHFKKTSNNIVFAFSAYHIKQILYAGLFISTSSGIQRLDKSQITIEDNIVKLNPSIVPNTLNEVSITLRYIHAPTYYIVEMKRETMQTFKYQIGNELIQHMPLSAMGRRAHYVLTAPNLQGDRLIDNSYSEEDINCEINCNCCQ